MRILTTVIRGRLSFLRNESVITCRLLDVKPVSKLIYQENTRGQAMSCMQGYVLKQKPLVVIFQPKRDIYNGSLGKPPIQKIFTPLYSKDSVPRDYEIIYQSTLGEKQLILFVLLGVVFLSYFMLFSYLLLLYNGEWKFEAKTNIPVLEIEIPTLTVNIVSTLTIFVLFFYYMAAPYAKLPVKRIYESPCKQKFIGILKKNAFRTERVEFSISDVTSTLHSGRKLLRKGNANIKGKGVLLYAMDFKVPQYFNQFIGVDPVWPEKKADS